METLLVVIGKDYLVGNFQAFIKILKQIENVWRVGEGEGEEKKKKMCILFNHLTIPLLGLYPIHLPSIFTAAKYENFKCLSIAK